MLEPVPDLPPFVLFSKNAQDNPPLKSISGTGNVSTKRMEPKIVVGGFLLATLVLLFSAYFFRVYNRPRSTANPSMA